MVDDGQHHVVRIAVLETEIAHMKVQQHKGFEDLKTLILEAKTAFQDRAEKEDQNKKTAEEKRSTREWAMIITFLVAGLGFISNTAQFLLQGVLK
jgi:hypothetical protein